MIYHRLSKRISGVALMLLGLSLFSSHSSASELERITVIIQNKPSASAVSKLEGSANISRLAQQSRQAIKAKLSKNLSQNKIKIVREFNNFPLISVNVSKAQLLELQQDSSIQVYSNALRFPQLANSVPLIYPTQETSPYHGDNKWAVAVLDSGIESTHEFLASKVISQACFSTNNELVSATSLCPDGPDPGNAPDEFSTAIGSGEPCNSAIAMCDHGTQSAGVIAGSGMNYDGVARQAKLISVQVYSLIDDEVECGINPSPCIGAFATDIIAALDHIMSIRNQYSIAAVNLGLGFDSGGNIAGTCNSEPEAVAIQALRNIGIPVIVPSGNDGYGASMRIPACVGDAIAVAASNNSDVISGQSNISNALDLFAPGVAVETSTLGNMYSVASGTSIAAAHVAGAWAVLKNKAPHLNVDQIETVLKSHGPQLNASGNTFRRIDVSATLDSLPEEPEELCFPIIVGDEGKAAVICL